MLDNLEAVHAVQLEKDLQRLKKDLLATGEFKASGVYYSFTIAVALLIAVASILLLRTHSIWGTISAVAVFTFYFPQLAFIGHDFAHNQVFRENHSGLNKWLGGFVFGGLMQGLSRDWWRSRHNAHHAKPNMYKVVGDTTVFLDDDINTAPLVVWDIQLLTPTQARALKYWLPLQRYGLFLFLPFTRFSWMVQSLVNSFERRNRFELPAIIAHYLGFFLLLMHVADLSFAQALLFWFFTNMTGSLMLSWIFILNHSGKDVFTSETELGFFHSQLRSTRNISSGPWMNWLTGGLNLQLEHHLFPTLPRHQLPKIAGRVRDIVERNGFAYESLGFFAATRLIFNTLPRQHDVAPIASQHFTGSSDAPGLRKAFHNQSSKIKV
jgi:fatty acid desaturase